MSASSIRALLAALILSGCSTIAVDRAQELSETGKQYASTIKRVHELALDRSIDYCAELIAHEQQDLGPDLLDRRTDELRQRVALAARAEAERAREHISALPSSQFKDALLRLTVLAVDRTS